MAPRLHYARHDQPVDHDHDQAAPTIPVRYANEVEVALLLDFFGVNDLAGVEGAEERTVRLSERSTVVCPAHGKVLKPDACRSCRFLAGEMDR
jgi:hypothetical protein